MYRRRAAEQRLKDILAGDEVSVILGARQVGKTTLAERVLAGNDAVFLNFDDPRRVRQGLLEVRTMKRTTHAKGNVLPKRLSALYAEYPIRPIHDEVDLDNAMEMADRLAVLAKRTDDQNDYLMLLSDVIEKYEQEHHPIYTGKLDPIETLTLLMRQHNMSASDLGRVLGNRSLGTKILNRTRRLSQSNISALCRHFAVGPQVFFKV